MAYTPDYTTGDVTSVTIEYTGIGKTTPAFMEMALSSSVSLLSALQDLLHSSWCISGQGRMSNKVT